MQFRSMLGLAAALGLAASGASAQGLEWRAPESPTEADVAEARQDYARGLESLEAGEAAEALARFRLSFARSGAAPALFNAAVALTRLERWVEARAALDVLFELEAPEPVRAAARALGVEVDAHLAHLRVVGVPDAARVVLDGRPVPLAPGARELDERLDPGEHRLSVRAGAAPPFTWRGALLPGERRVVSVELEASTPLEGSGDDATLGAVLGVVAAVLVAGAAIAAAIVLDDQAQLRPDAPHVVRLP